jgi:hypothetical protein
LPSADRCYSFGEVHRLSHCASDLCLLKKKVFSSWDKFQIPFPWTKGLFVWGEPILVTSHLKKEALVESGLALEHILNTLTEQAELAVQQSDPAASFLHATSEGPSSSIR